jgi:GTPase KRas
MATTVAFAITVMGDKQVAKSALLVSYIEQNFNDAFDPRFVHEYRKQANVIGQSVVLILFDDWQSERAAADYVLAFDVCKRSSFDATQGCHERIERLQKEGGALCVLVGNKCDVDEQQRQVSFGEGVALASKLRCQYFETSARSRLNVDDMFQSLPLKKGEKGQDDEAKSHCSIA